VEVCPWLVAALYQCIFIALYVRKNFDLKTALFVAFNLVHAKNCIICRSDAQQCTQLWLGAQNLTSSRAGMVASGNGLTYHVIPW
jgi:hypothetical protein